MDLIDFSKNLRQSVLDLWIVIVDLNFLKDHVAASIVILKKLGSSF